MKTILHCVIALLTAGALHAEVATVAETRALSDKIMGSVATGDYKTAFATAALHWPMPKEEIDALRAKTDERLKMVQPRFGTLLGSEFVSTQAAGASLIRYDYIQKFSNHAVHWTIVFYRPQKTWMINVIVWEDSLKDIFDLQATR